MTPYKILGLDDDATIDQIEAAYRERVKRYHPDSGGDSWAYQQVLVAYEQLMKKLGQPGNAELTIPEKSGPKAPTNTALAAIHPVVQWLLQRWVAVAVVTVVLLMTFCLLQSVWRLVFIVMGLAGLGCATWLAYLGTTKRDEQKILALVGSGAVAVLALILLSMSLFSGGVSSLRFDDLEKTSPAIVATVNERDFSQALIKLGSSVVTENTGGKLRLFTNAHVIGLEDVAGRATKQRDRTANITQFALEVQFPSGAKRRAERVGLAADPNLDVACIEVNPNGLVAGLDYVVVPKVSNAMKVLEVKNGGEVVAVGTPLDILFANSMTFGRISSLRAPKSATSGATWIQHDASISPGNSGGPLFLRQGERYHWIGINTRGADGAALSMAISADEVSSAELIWADANPAGAAQLIGQVYGVAAAVGDQESSKHSTGLDTSINSTGPNAPLALQTQRERNSKSTHQKTDILGMAFRLSRFGYLLWIVVPAVLAAAGAWITKTFRSASVEDNSQKSIPADNGIAKKGWGEVECPQCKRNSYTMYSVGHCPGCGYGRKE
ncbi:heat shock protein DnaJ domain protein [Pirellula staleyi DSM 6068]|uniref:Heat shock protein DnaJ domain protein n=1 Tax=Pirellula staleyi (strain ATCC 27377 / DSM 6068 / ICPB 4128) TaxID=530564 RepID=D2QY05_PIRSD|nr:trypsin-like peptidase domain-containing protein [Pirellula staleyi]ADB18082.1 heat shock protein DnaJ domain protein [Pirellula staleyi DSM 6068]